MKAILAACVLLAGCSVLQPSPPVPQKPALSAAAAERSLSIGQSTKADVLAALGKGVVVDFESGYEVWVYREKPPASGSELRAELVLLFGPSGILAKTRVR